MEQSEFFSLLDSLYAFDEGATDSGINDKITKNKIRQYLAQMLEMDLVLLITSFVREYYLSDSAINSGYSIIDVLAFLEWLDREMNICIN
ncbi:MAG: hypothetical protein H6Q73_209 [Firmicutes bacterium]|nr:hypothetical protein [Bacillota bacterium]